MGKTRLVAQAQKCFIGIVLAVLFLSACSPQENRRAVVTTPTAPTPTQPAQVPALEQLEATATIAQPATAPVTTPAQLVPTQAIDQPPTAPPESPEVGAGLQFPDVNRYYWQPIVAGLQKPLGLTHAGDGSGRIFIVEQAGVIRILQAGVLLTQPFLDISQRVGSKGSEQGLLGLAFHPRYQENGYFYVNYTDLQGNTRVSRFSVSADDPDRGNPDSESTILQIDQPFANHNGGEVIFGPDGYLYLGLGDGGSGGDPLGSGQSLSTLLGKILRIDVDSGQPYAIPPDNPFIHAQALPEIWAYGLRNPWRFSFDQLSGELYVADVGQNQWEEVNWLPAGQGGANFGWNYFEGSHPYQDAGNAPATVFPVAEYNHTQGCSVTGGVVYRGQDLPAWNGIYLYGDYCSGNVWGLLPQGQGDWQSQLLFQGIGRISSFGQDERGEVYLIDHGGVIYQLSGR